MLCTINGSVKAVEGNIYLIKNHITFDEMDAAFYAYFTMQPYNIEDHRTFKKLEDDLYIKDGGVFDGNLVRLNSNHMNIIDLSGDEATIHYEKIRIFSLYYKTQLCELGITSKVLNSISIFYL